MKKDLIFIFFLVVSFLGRAQESQFSQFFASSAYLNPGFVGLEPTTSLAINHKSAVTDGEGALKELSHVSVIHPIHKLTSFVSQSAGVGGTFVQEKSGYEGIYQTTQMLLAGAYVIRFDYEGKKLLSFGLQGGIVQTRINTDDLRYGSQYNPYIGYDNTLAGEEFENYNHIAPVFNYGMVYSYTDHHNPILSQNSMTVGVSIHNINKPRDGFMSNERRPVQLKAVATARKKTCAYYFLHPSAYVLYVKGSYQINGGLYLSRYVGAQLNTLLQIGSWYRHNDSFIFLAGMRYQNWKVGFSFDLNSKAINQNEVLNIQTFDPTVEVSFGYSFSFKDKLVRATNPLF
ncbi:MAG: PorP/SprF family type IX secretion system membrane protein [Cyclobacteriaceae bacterium]